MYYCQHPGILIERRRQMSRRTTAELTASAFALAVLVSTPPVQAAELTDAELDQITAGAFIADPSNNIIVDINQHSYTRISDTAPYNYIDELGNTWTPAVLYYDGNTAIGVLIGPNGQIWDGGFTTVIADVPTPLPGYTYKIGNGLI
jgi:hypothetical protein